MERKVVKRNRELRDEKEVFFENAWDNVEWDEEYVAHIDTVMAQQKEKNNEGVKNSEIFELQREKWDDFYKCNGSKFFKDRKWVLSEYTELTTHMEANNDMRLLEVGCGVGNFILPLFEHFQELNINFYCFDYSSTAIDILKSDHRYRNNPNNSKMTPFVCDATSEKIDAPDDYFDFAVLIFVLSSIEYNKIDSVLSQIYKKLKKGGILLFRDYGRHDMAQLRFKSKSVIDDNCYVRGDGTVVHFFDKNELDQIFEKNKFKKISSEYDKRLIVNRMKKLKMYRNWIQASFVK